MIPMKRMTLFPSGSFAPPPAAMIAVLVTTLALSIGLSFLMPLFPLLGLLGALAIILVVSIFLQSRLALPLYILVAGPSVALSLASSGLLSRLYIGNLLFLLVTVIWILRIVLPERKSGRLLLEPMLLAPLLALILVGLVSILYSRLFPDPNVPYTYPHSTLSITVTNVAEMALLVGLPLFLLLVPGVIRSVRDVRWVIGAYVCIGMLYALGTIFAAPLGLYSNQVILGNRRPQVFGSVSSGLGDLILLFTCLAFGQLLYANTARTRLLWGLASLIFGLGVVMTFGRESWVGLFLAVLVMVAFGTKNWTVFLVLIVPLILLFIPGVSDFFNPSKTYGVDRLQIWQDAITIWQRSPFFGVGAGNFQFFDRVYGHDKVGVAHNQYLEVLAEMGVQGLICLIWLLAAVGVRTFKSFKKAKTSLGKSIALAYIGFYTNILFAGFFTGIFIPSSASGGGTGPFVEASYRWLLLGLVLSIPIWEKEVEEAGSSAAPRLDGEPVVRLPIQPGSAAEIQQPEARQISART
jgi:O-antigen ligase